MILLRIIFLIYLIIFFVYLLSFFKKLWLISRYTYEQIGFRFGIVSIVLWDVLYALQPNQHVDSQTTGIIFITFFLGLPMLFAFSRIGIRKDNKEKAKTIYK